MTTGIGADLRNLVERAFPETAVEVVEATGDEPTAYRSDDAEAAWQRMHEAAGGREVAVLLEMLEGTWLTGEERWKAVTFLGYSLRTADAAASRDAILEALAGEATLKQRGAASGDALRLQGAALQAVANAPIEAEAKWQFMLDTVQGSRTNFRQIVRALSGFRPANPQAAADACPILLDAMVRSDNPGDLDGVATLVHELDVRSAIPDLRRLLLAANSSLSARVAAILADWQDPQAAFEIRRAINQYSMANDPNVDVMFDSLFRLEGRACTAYLAGVFRQAPPALQEYLLEHSLRSMPTKAIVEVVRDVATSTNDVELRQAAEAYLRNAPENPAEDEATDGGTAAASLSTSEAATDGWKPVYENEPDAARPVVPPAPVQQATREEPVAAAPAAPVSSAAAAAPSAAPEPGSWQPTVDSPQSGASADERNRRLGAEAEYLARLREDAAREAEERAAASSERNAPLELLVRLPMILFALFVIGALVAVILTMGEPTAPKP